MTWWGNLRASVVFCNYPDENTVDVGNLNYDELHIKLWQLGNECDINCDMKFMQVDPFKRQYIVFSKKQERRSLCLKLVVILQPRGLSVLSY